MKIILIDMIETWQKTKKGLNKSWNSFAVSSDVKPKTYQANDGINRFLVCLSTS